MKRIFDFTLAVFLMILLSPLIIMVSIFIYLSDPGSVLYWSDRIGINNSIFAMPKFRSMRINTPQVATHLLDNSISYLIHGGGFLRKTSLDEIPQLWSILKGDMSFVGPRPALYNQDDLISLRTKKRVHLYRPGLTGWAQVNGRDEIEIPQKVELDDYYCKNQSFFFDIKIIFFTFLKVIARRNITH